jgi:hypothetical protein
MRNVSDKICGVNQNTILCSITFSRQPYSVSDNVEKYGRAGHVTDDNIIRRVRFACWINNATDTYTENM